MRLSSLTLLGLIASMPLLSPVNTGGPVVPKGLQASDWQSIQEAHERARYAAVPESGGYQARSWGQQWLAHFDGRGFTLNSDSGRWSWGLELKSYGVSGHEQAVTAAARTSAAGDRIRYERGSIEEWFINSRTGLEQGFTIRSRPEGSARTLSLSLRVRGELVPKLASDGITFTDSYGGSVLTYAGLKAWDADGKTLGSRFNLDSSGDLELEVDEQAARYPVTIDPIAQQAYLKASNTDAMDTFGNSVAIDGATVVVGAPGESSNATGVNGNQADNSAGNSGAAYVFVRSGSSWSQQAYLKASNTDAGDQFGYSVAISTDTIVVGAQTESSSATGVNGNQADNSAQNSGAAYVFVRSGTTWSQQAYLKASNTDIQDFFGFSVAISTDTIVVGAYDESSNATGVNGNQADNSASAAGATYVFVRSGATWSQQAYLKASNTDANDQFGLAVAISGDTIAVGALNESSNATGVNGNQADNSSMDAGAAYVFVRSGVTWTQQAYLKASNTDALDRFGSAVGISGDTVVVGAYVEASNATGVNGNQADNSLPVAGAAYVFIRTGVTWTQQAYLKASNTDQLDSFGRAVAISGDTVVVGAYEESSNATGVNGNQADNSAMFAGAAYVFTRSGITWTQQAYLKASNTDASAHFGVSVAVSGGTAVIGAYGEQSSATGGNGTQADNSATLAGASYVFTLSQLSIDTSSPLPFGTAGSSYLLQLTVSGGSGNFAWSILSGTLPPNLNLDPVLGKISGTPTTAGTFSFTVQVLDNQNMQTISKAFTIGVPQITTAPPLPQGTFNVAYSTTLQYTDGPPAMQWSVSAGSLPSGIQIDPNTGVISGTTSSSGTFNFTAMITGGGATATRAYSLVINGSSSLTITTSSLATPAAGQSYSQTVTASGGVPPYGFSATGLPSPLVISASGTITGTPACSGAFPINVTVVDSLSDRTTKAFTLNVSPALTITTSSLPNGTAGQAYSQTVQATGGFPGYHFSATGLPSGLGISFAGVISGTTPVTGNFSVSVTATDTGTGVASKGFTLVINAASPPLTITSTSVFPGAIGQSYQQLIMAMGGVPPYNFAAVGLPAGLSISGNGLITGAPSVGGSLGFTVIVTDSQNHETSGQFTISITTPISILTTSLARGSVGHSYFQSILVSSGQGSTTFSASGLPSGLVITNTGVISGTPSAAGTFTVSVTVSNGVSSASAQFTIQIDGLPSITTSSPLPLGTVGASYKTIINASGGVLPYTFFLLSGNLPAGLTLGSDGTLGGVVSVPGLYSFTVQVIDKNRNSATANFQITISPGSQPLTLSPSSVQFSAPVGGDTPGSQDLLITSNSFVPLPFVVQLDDGNGGPAPGFVNVTPTSGLTPGSVRVTVASGPVDTGTVKARVRISLSAAGNSLIDVPIALTLTPPSPQLGVQPSILRFVGHAAIPSVSQQSFVLRNPGGGGALPVSLAVVNQSPWIKSVTPSAPAIQPNSPVLVSVAVDTQGLSAGSYRDVIHVTAGTNAVDLPITLFVANPGPFLSDSLDGVRFATRESNPTSRTQLVTVRNLGDPGTTVSWTAQVLRGADLVVLSNPSGNSTPSNPTSFGVTLSSAAATSAGGKFALIQVSAPNAENSPEYFSVVADVAAADAPPLPDPSPAGLAFFVGAASAASAAQQVIVNTTSADAVAFSVSPTSDDGGKWLIANASGTTTSLTSPAQVAVSVNPATLAAGIYTGLVNIAIGKVVRSVNVIAVVKSAGTVAPLESLHSASACAPSRIAFVETGLANNFSVPAGWPASLAAQVADDCGNILSNASVVASFSNGDAPLSLTGDQQDGAYSATWQPGRSTSPMTITLDATSGSLSPATVQITGGVDPNATPAPSLVIAGLLQNLNPQVGGAIAPGTVTQAYGDNLAASPDAPQGVPLPVTYKGVSALIAGVSAPIYYISKTQLTIQIPVELAPNHTYPVILVSGSQYSLPQNVDLVPVAPGTVAYPDGTLVAQHTDFSLVDAAHPSHPGETLIIYLVGMGSTTPPVSSGNAAPSNPLAAVDSAPQMTIDGQQAEVLFAGQTPGGVGLYQINVKVPGGVKDGSLNVVISQGGVVANATKLIVAH